MKNTFSLYALCLVLSLSLFGSCSKDEPSDGAVGGLVFDPNTMSPLVVKPTLPDAYFAINDYGDVFYPTYSSFLAIFSVKGNPSKMVETLTSSSYTETETYEWNEKKQLIKDRYYSYTYDNSGKLIKSESSFSGNYTYTYNSAGYCTQRRSSYNSGSFYYTNYTYDNNGTKLLKEQSDSYKPIQYEYSGNNISRSYYENPNLDSSQYETRFKYNSTGYLIELTGAYYSNNVLKYTYKNGRLSQFHVNGELYESFTYNSNGDIETGKREMSESVKWTYTYDQKGNWTEMKTEKYENGTTATSTYTRTFTYR